MTAKQSLYLRMPVSAFTAENRALKSAGGCHIRRIWYNDCKAVIIPAPSGGARRKPKHLYRERASLGEIEFLQSRSQRFLSPAGSGCPQFYFNHQWAEFRLISRFSFTYVFSGMTGQEYENCNESRDTERNGCCRQKRPERREERIQKRGRYPAPAEPGEILKITVDISVCL